MEDKPYISAQQAQAEAGPRQDGVSVAKTKGQWNGVIYYRTTVAWANVEDELPDAETTVLVHVPHGNEPVWLGYLGEGGWCDVDGSYIRNKVTHWANLPECPRCKWEKMKLAGCLLRGVHQTLRKPRSGDAGEIKPQPKDAA